MLSGTPVLSQSVTLTKRAPPIDLPALNGGRVDLSKFRGHPVVISFWTTWCPPCRVEFPELIRIHSAYASDGLYVVAVNGRDQEYSTKEVQRFVDHFIVPFPIALDTRGSVRRAYRIEGQPSTVFIDAAGIIRSIHTGRITPAELEAGIALIIPRTH
ncbi:MAG TPA: TlpA disulfide reductase family protein [Gemmatimonadaceae bacterium]|nr:TlpA disulfide reductase family protein [Gemmatimonadaceae bacterium]